MTTKKTAHELMSPSQEELDRGDQAVRDLVAHLKRMGAGGTTQTVPDGACRWVIDVEWKPNKDVKPN